MSFRMVGSRLFLPLVLALSQWIADAVVATDEPPAATPGRIELVHRPNTMLIAAAVSDDGRRAMTVSAASLRVWDVGRAQPLFEYRAQGRIDDAQAVFDKGLVLLIESEGEHNDRHATILHSESGLALGRLAQRERSAARPGGVRVQASPDATKALVAFHEFEAWLIDLPGYWQVSASTLWLRRMLGPGRPRATHLVPVPSPRARHGPPSASRFVWSPDSRYIYARVAQGFHAWDAATGAPLRHQYDHEVHAILSPTGVIAVECRGWSPRREDPMTNRSVSPPLEGLEEGEVRRCLFSPDGALLLAGSDRGQVVLWDMPSGDQVVLHQVASRPVSMLAFDGSGRRYATALRSAGVWVWERGRDRPVLQDGMPGHFLALNATGTMLVLGTDRGVAYVYRL
jgi:WD40 repeat protein